MKHEEITDRIIRIFYEVYNRIVVEEFVADLVVESKIIVEIKAAESIARAHEFQLVNYLKCSEIEVGLLLNFGKKPEIRRKVFSH